LWALAIAKWPLFQENVKIARAAVMAMGGNARDGDQLGHLIAGRWTMTSDEPLTDDVEQLKRFRPYIMSRSRPRTATTKRATASAPCSD
jgi:hypothetical protein